MLASFLSPPPKWLLFLADWSLPPYIASLVLSVPSVILYLVEVIVIWWQIWKKSDNFSTAFYKLFLIRAIYDLGIFFFGTSTIRLTRFGLLLGVFRRLPNVLLGFCVFICYVSLASSTIATMMMSINRFTAVSMPFKHEKFWKLWLRRTIFVIFLFPLSYNLHILIVYRWFIHVHEKSGGGHFTFDTINRLEHGEEFDPALINTLINFVLMLISLVFSVWTLIVFRLHNDEQNEHEHNTQHQNYWLQTQTVIDDQSRLSRKLMLYALFTFVCHFFQTFYTAGLWLTATGVFGAIPTQTADLLFLALTNFGPLIIDVCMHVVPSWLLLWASDNVREIIVLRPFKSLEHLFTFSTVHPSAENNDQNQSQFNEQASVGEQQQAR